MFTVKDKEIYEFLIKKSKFIVVLKHIKNEDDAHKFLKDIRNIYPKATHYCYAYVIGAYSKYSDDGEPSGVAGIQILNSLNSRKINNLLCVIIRYFGGIKFGASNLLRTYGKLTRDSLDNSNLLEIINYDIHILTFDYDKINIINNIVNDYIVNKTFDEKVIYEIKIPSDKSNYIISNLNNYKIDIK